MKCNHISRRRIIEHGMIIGYECDLCGKEMCSFKRRTAIWLAKYMTLNSQGNSITNFIFGKIDSFLKWSLYFFGASFTTGVISNQFSLFRWLKIPDWAIIVFMSIPIINIITDPLVGYLLKKWGFTAELARYNNTDRELNPTQKEILDNTRTIIKELNQRSA